MASENSNSLELAKIKIVYQHLKEHLCFSIPDVCMTGGMHYTPSHANVCKFFNFQLPFSQLILHLKC